MATLPQLTGVSGRGGGCGNALYSVLTVCGDAYDSNTNYEYMAQFMFWVAKNQQGRNVVWHPETTYWVPPALHQPAQRIHLVLTPPTAGEL